MQSKAQSLSAGKTILIAYWKKTVYCDFTSDFFGGVSNRNADQKTEFAKCRDPNFENFSITPADPIYMGELKAFVADNHDSIYRVKGFCHTDEHGPVYIDYSKTGWEIQFSAGNTAAVSFLSLHKRAPKSSNRFYPKP